MIIQIDTMVHRACCKPGQRSISADNKQTIFLLLSPNSTSLSTASLIILVLYSTKGLEKNHRLSFPSNVTKINNALLSVPVTCQHLKPK